MKSETIFILVGLSFVIGTIIFSLIGYEQISRKGLCVDGDGDINLEGLMCDKPYWSIFGLSEYETGLVSIIIFSFFMVGLVFILATTMAITFQR